MMSFNSIALTNISSKKSVKICSNMQNIKPITGHLRDFCLENRAFREEEAYLLRSRWAILSHFKSARFIYLTLSVWQPLSLFTEHCLCSWGNFYGKPLAAGSHSWLPAPLECSLADAKNAGTVQNNRNEVQLLLHDVYFIRSKIHRST